MLYPPCKCLVVGRGIFGRDVAREMVYCHVILIVKVKHSYEVSFHLRAKSPRMDHMVVNDCMTLKKKRQTYKRGCDPHDPPAVLLSMD